MKTFAPSPGAPATDGVAVTKSDSVNFTRGVCRALYIGDVSGGSAMTVVFANGDVVAFTGLAAGQIVPFSVLRVNATGTTAASIVALY